MKLSTRIISVIVVVIMVLAIVSYLISITANPKLEQNIIVTIDNKVVDFNDDMGHPFISSKSRTMVPLRIISENMGYDVEWDGKARTAVIKKGTDTIKMTIDKTTALVNGKSVNIDTDKDGNVVDTKVIIINSRTYVPIRFVSEAMGAEVGYDQKADEKSVTHFVSINTGKVVANDRIDKTFEPAKDLMPDGRLTVEKTNEYIEQMIEGTTVKKEGGKYYLEYNRPAVPEGFVPGIKLDVKRHTALGYSLTTDDAYVERNQLPKDQSFVKELDPEIMNDVNFFKFSLSVSKPDVGVATVHYIWYYPEDNDAHYAYTDTVGGVVEWEVPFDKDRLFKGL